MSDRFDLSVRPTPDQVKRFRALSPNERYLWLAGLLRTMHRLATDETRSRWRALKQAQSGGFLSVASAFASALDRAAWVEAAGCLSADCTYEIGERTVKGVDAIIGAYREDHDWAAQTIERVKYRSVVDGVLPGVACVTFEDRIEHAGLRHVYRCQQEMSIGRSRLIERIVHHEIEGQREALEAFLSAAGIHR